MDDHYHCVVLQLPPNVARDLTLLQMQVYKATGAVSSQAIPPFIPIEPVGPAADAYPWLLERVSRAIQAEFPMLELRGPCCRTKTLTIATSWSRVRRGLPADRPRDRMQATRPFLLPHPPYDTLYDVYLADEDSRCSDALIQVMQETWDNLPGTSAEGTIRVRAAHLQIIEIESRGLPWWNDVDWRVLEEVRLRLTPATR